MAWEQRGNRDYYYRSVRVGGRVVKEYGGGGLMGYLAAESDEDQREQRAARRERERAERERWAALEGPTDELAELTDILVTVALADAGYRRHARGEWRRRRGRGDEGNEPASGSDR